MILIIKLGGDMDEKRIIEINGVKMEVDLREATVIDTFRIGSKVKILISESEKPEVHPGIIIGFEDFPSLPTIVIAYLKTDYWSSGVRFLYFNSDTKNTEVIVADSSYVPIEKSEVIRKMNKEIEEKMTALADLKAKKKYFEDNFGVYFDTGKNAKTG
jgi:hypothetical protein